MEVEDKLWREMFFKDNFNVDHCLSKHIFKTDLKVVCDDLKHYGNELHHEMSEILQMETEEIVNVAEHLTKLHSYIANLSLPVNQLREEIKILFDILKVTRISFNKSLRQMGDNSAKQNYCLIREEMLESTKRVPDLKKVNEFDLSDQCIIIERIVNNFCFDYHYLKLNNFSLDGLDIIYIKKVLLGMVNNVFLQVLKNKDEKNILRILRIYENLGQAAEAEKIYRSSVLEPALKNIFNESYLEMCHQDMGMLYEKSLHILNSEMSILLDILKKNKDLLSFNFVLNSFWAEVDKQTRDNLPHVMAPGNPDLFQKRFKKTWLYLEEISRAILKSGASHSEDSFQNYLKRYNLSVYFEIRFQQIGAKFENSAILKYDSDDIYLDNNELGCSLKITLTFWQSLQTCFDNDVFIINLADKFMKLSMYLLARYVKWFECLLKVPEITTDMSARWDTLLIKCINDITIIDALIGDNHSHTSKIFDIFPMEINQSVLKLRSLNSDQLSKSKIQIRDALIKRKCTYYISQLQNVNSIPRLYRRTNRPVPTSPSAYIVEVVTSTLRLYENLAGGEVDNIRQAIVHDIIVEITKEYSALLDKVLQSLCKTEESLRRLKGKSQFTTEDSDNPSAMSDEMKIREQIKLDVVYFLNQLKYIISKETEEIISILKDHAHIDYK